jgi:hypothetical protein
VGVVRRTGIEPRRRIGFSVESAPGLVSGELIVHPSYLKERLLSKRK